MSKLPKAGIAVLGILGVVCTLALPGAAVSRLLFLSTFDLPGETPSAELGDWVESSTAGGITLVPSLGGGRELHFDSHGLGGQVLYLSGLFEDTQSFDSGHVRLSLVLQMVDVASPFMVGLIVDNPTSDFVPATGPGGDGLLWINQQPTNNALPVGENLFFTVDVWRASRFEDWNYSVSVNYEQPCSESSTGGGAVESTTRQLNGSGTVEGSLLLPVIGLRLEKMSSTVGIISVNDVKVTLITEAN